MGTYEMIAPCHFGLEAVLKREIQELGYEILLVEDGKVTFRTDEQGICRANMFLRTAERVLLKVGGFRAVTFDELFEKTKALPWEQYKSIFGEEPAVQPFGYPVHREKSHGGADEGALPCELV